MFSAGKNHSGELGTQNHCLSHKLDSITKVAEEGAWITPLNTGDTNQTYV